MDIVWGFQKLDYKGRIALTLPRLHPPPVEHGIELTNHVLLEKESQPLPLPTDIEKPETVVV